MPNPLTSDDIVTAVNAANLTVPALTALLAIGSLQTALGQKQAELANLIVARDVATLTANTAIASKQAEVNAAQAAIQAAVSGS